jgi:hypothetical protein
MFSALESLDCENVFEKNSETKQRNSENISVKFRHFPTGAELAQGSLPLDARARQRNLLDSSLQLVIAATMFAANGYEPIRQTEEESR